MAYKVYTGNPVFAGADFYIHKRKRDIGKAAGHNFMNDADIASVFNKQKLSAGEAAKTYYKTLFLDNLKIDDEAMELLNGTFDNDKEKMISEIDKQVKEALQKSINQDQLERLMTLYKSSAEVSKKLLNAPEALKAFNQLIENFAQASELVRGPLGSELATCLRAKMTNFANNFDLTKMGLRLYSALDDFVEQNNFIPLDEIKMSYVVNALNRLAENLTHGKTTTGQDITEENITRMVDQLFSKGFSEVIGSQINEVAELTFDAELAKVVGDQGHKVQITDTKGQMVGQSGQKRAGKTDIKLSNVMVALDYSSAPYGGYINMDIGISNKFYRTERFPGVSYDGETLSFGGGSGGTLKEALNSLFDSNFEHYLAYNTLAYGNKLPAANMALNDIILTRQINRVFATRGGTNDFSQFVLVNGYVVSIWELIQYATANVMGYSNSQEGSANQGAALSIKGRPEILQALNSSNQARIRVPKVNNAVNKATISAHVHIDKLSVASLTK